MQSVIIYKCFMMERGTKRPRRDEDCENHVSDFRRWDVEETVVYLRRAGFGKWEQKFRGTAMINNTNNIFTTRNVRLDFNNDYIIQMTLTNNIFTRNIALEFHNGCLV